MEDIRSEFVALLTEFLDSLHRHTHQGWTTWWNNNRPQGLPRVSQRTIGYWLSGRESLDPDLWAGFVRQIQLYLEEKPNDSLRNSLEKLHSAAQQILVAQQENPRSRSGPKDLAGRIAPEGFKKVFGRDSKIYLIYSELTLNPLLTEIIDAYERFLQPPADYQVLDRAVSNDLKMRPLVTVDPNKHDGSDRYRFRAENSSCVCEVRASAYLASALVKFESPTFSIVANTDPEVHLKSDISFVSFGTLINSKTRELLADRNALVRFENGRFVSNRSRSGLNPGCVGGPLHPFVKADGEHDYGMIIRVSPKAAPSSHSRVWIACAGVEQLGTSAAAWVLANRWDEIAAGLKENTGHFACLVQVNKSKKDQFAELKWVVERPEDFEKYELS